MSSSIEFGITEPIPLRADFNFLLHYVITIHQRYKRTDGRTDVMLVA